MAILDTKKDVANGLLSKIVIGGKTYEMKDVIAREAIDALSYVAYTNIFANDAAIKSYVDSQVGTINKFDVKVVDAAYVAGTPTDADMYILHLVADANAEAGAYLEYIVIREGAEGSYTYKWEQIGSTKVSLDGYMTNEKFAEEWAKLGALAVKDSASGTVAGQTISGVKATGNSAGSIEVVLTETEAAVASTGKFTPAGSVTGTVTPSGSVSVTVSTSAADATLTKGDYTPAGSVSVSLSGATFNKITGVGSQASFTEGAFTPAACEYSAAEGNFATEGIVGSVADETLTFTAAGVQALSASKITSFSGGSKAKDTFVANSLPTMAENTVGIQSATFSGELAEDLVVTGVSYAKANASAAATFSGDTNDISATFAGTEKDVNVSGMGKTYAVDAANTKFNPAAIELAVGDIKVADQDVTVQ